MSTQFPPGQGIAGEPPPDDDNVRAAEYALGVLDVAEIRELEARARVDHAFAGLIVAWERRFQPWLEELELVTPPPVVWERIRRRVGAPVAAPSPSLWNSVVFWRFATGLVATAALAVFAIAISRLAPQVPRGEEQAARPVTVLARDDGSPAWIASLDLAQGKVHMVPVPSPADAGGRVDELWIIPAGQKPISLGFVSNEKAHSISFPATVRSAFAVGATFAVTLEPQAGMPHAAPSGPVVAKGAIQTI